MTGTTFEIDHEVIVVGAGFGGMYALHRLRDAGFDVRGIEAGADVGGTWYWNRYPGARCDVESIDYSYSFSEELDRDWDWSERYATQPEIQRYSRYVAERLELLPDITFGTRVTQARFDETSATWTIETDQGRTLSCRFLVLAVGALSAAQTPQLEGLHDFAGSVLHTGRWPEEGVDLSGKRVGVIGTGSSGIQLIPEVAAQAAEVQVFQRTPNYSLPAQNRPLSDEERDAAKANYLDRRAATFTTRTGAVIPTTGKRIVDVPEEERIVELERSWSYGGNGFLATFIDTSKNLEANELLAKFVRSKIRQIVDDPELADRLTPQDYPIGAKRICVDSHYYAAFNRENVHLVDLRSEPLERITTAGVRTTAAEYPLDVLIMATGFDAMTGSFTRIDIRGRGDRSLREAWDEGARTYLGIAVSGFPNLFTLTGPGSPSVLVTVINAIEQHVDWLVDHLIHLRDEGFCASEATLTAQTEWAQEVHDATRLTLHVHAPSSWYLGTNIPGKPKQFLPYVGGLDTFRQICDDVAAAGYRGFDLITSPRTELSV